jgi:hypothetical protein
MSGSRAFWEHSKEEFWKTAEFLVNLLCHSLMLLAILLTIKALEFVLVWGWDKEGLVFFAGTNREFSVKMLFQLSELGLLVGLALSSIYQAYRIWFRK